MLCNKQFVSATKSLGFCSLFTIAIFLKLDSFSYERKFVPKVVEKKQRGRSTAPHPASKRPFRVLFVLFCGIVFRMLRFNEQHC